MRYFLVTGEPSGELSAVLLSQAIQGVDPAATFEGIGANRMAEAGIKLFRNHTGWASMGPIDAIPRIPPLLAACIQTAQHIVRTKPNLVILCDFGVFNVRLAKWLRERFHYDGAIMYLFPPSAWLDREGLARVVAGNTVPVVAFERQYNFYKSLKLPAIYFGHPLASQYPMRPRRPLAPSDGGTIALLPGSRTGELKYHVPALLSALRELRMRRPQLQAIFGAANDAGERIIARAVAKSKLENVRVVRGVRAAVTDADAAYVASGTAVLEVALLGVPAIALYIITPLLVGYGRRIYKGDFITLPNLMLGRGVVPELLQDAATPERLAQEMEAVLTDPNPQLQAFAELRTHLGPPNALNDCARFAFALAQAGTKSSKAP